MIDMAKVSTNVTIDEVTKKKAQALLADFGMDLSTAVNIFLKQMVYENAIPFGISRDIPNAETMAAIEEAEEMLHNPNAKKYHSVKELFEELDTDEI